MAFMKDILTRNMNSTPFVRQYDILFNKWGVLLCQKEYQTYPLSLWSSAPP